jgi:hypothetical protein
MGRVAPQHAWLYALALKLEAQLVRYSDGKGEQSYSIIGGSIRDTQGNTQQPCKETKRVQPRRSGPDAAMQTPARTPVLDTGIHQCPCMQSQDDAKKSLQRNDAKCEP